MAPTEESTNLHKIIWPELSDWLSMFKSGNPSAVRGTAG